MSSHTAPDAWEQELLARAYEPLRAGCYLETVVADGATLERAYDRCESFTYLHSRTFYVASGLLPKAERRAVRALYAFCRVSDDLVDRASDDEPVAGLEAWRQRSLSSSPSPDDWVALAWTDTCARYRIPVQYAEQLIEGVAHDLRITRYATFADLTSYAYGVASTVGLMSMHIVGFAGEIVIPYAVKLGVALQLTNILRDVGEDWRSGRIYLPQEELAAFGLGEADIAAGLVTESWREFMQFQIERVRCLYAEALPGIALLNRGGRFAIAAAAELYRGILDDIEAHGWDNLHRRAYLSGWEKARRLPGIWWRATTAAYQQAAV